MLEIYKGKKVLVTGHTGFKGAWLSQVLVSLGADVTGYALEPATKPALFELAGLDKSMNSIIGDVRDFDKLSKVVEDIKPEFVFHLAAQPIVRESYKQPRYTYETNVMGTVNVLEAVRGVDCVRSVLNVTTDKVYENHELERGYREDEPLDGDDPYSNSKSCSELVTHCYKKAFFKEQNIAVSTARAGNVIGGGDFAIDRIIPDCVRAVASGQEMIIRNPNSVRPYQHVLEPIYAYLMIGAAQYSKPELAGYYNVGPDEVDCITTERLVSLFAKQWGTDFAWKIQNDGGPKETTFLKLDNSKIKHVFGWKPQWQIEQAVEKTAEWTRTWLENQDIKACMEKQIKEYLGGINE